MKFEKLENEVISGLLYQIDFHKELSGITRIEFRKNDSEDPVIIEYIGKFIYRKIELTKENFKGYKRYFNGETKKEKKRLKSKLKNVVFEDVPLISEFEIKSLKSVIKRENFYKITRTINRKSSNINEERKLKLLTLSYILPFEGSIVNEFTSADLNNRADIVLFNDGIIHTFELKSKKDNLSRIAKQLEDYRKYSDYITLVINEKHKETVLKYTPENIGIIIESKGSLKEIRKATKLTPKSRTHLLWKEESLGLYEEDWFKDLGKEEKNSIVAKIIEKRYSLSTKDILFDPFNLFKQREDIEPVNIKDFQWK